MTIKIGLGIGAMALLALAGCGSSSVSFGGQGGIPTRNPGLPAGYGQSYQLPTATPQSDGTAESGFQRRLHPNGDERAV